MSISFTSSQKLFASLESFGKETSKSMEKAAEETIVSSVLLTGDFNPSEVIDPADNLLLKQIPFMSDSDVDRDMPSELAGITGDVRIDKIMQARQWVDYILAAWQ